MYDVLDVENVIPADWMFQYYCIHACVLCSERETEMVLYQQHIIINLKLCFHHNQVTADRSSKDVLRTRDVLSLKDVRP